MASRVSGHAVNVVRLTRMLLTGSTVDGPGVRLVAWTAGCQWRCLYCHNPDTWNLMNGMPVTIERAVEELGKYSHGLKVMGGGLTLSGGEPLMQDRFAVRLFTAARAMGIHTAIETNGYLGERLTDHELAQMGRYKWKELAINYTLQDVEPPTNEMIERACEQFRAVGLTAY